MGGASGSDTEFQWTLEMVTSGGGYSLQAYPQYHKLVLVDGRYIVERSLIERWHRMNIGTITSDASVQVCFLRGKSVIGFRSRVAR